MNKVDLLLSDFRNYLAYIWRFLNLPQPTPIQYEIGDFLQGRDHKRKVIEGFRGVGKSWVTSAYVTWQLRLDPQLKFLVVSASKSRSDDFSIFTQRLIREVPLLQDLQPRDNQRSSMLAFDVGPSDAAHAASVKSVGVFGQLTGSRANEIVADDVEVPNNSLTPDMRHKLVTTISEFEDIIVPGGRITFLGTPQTEESIYNKLPAKGYKTRIWPAQVPTNDTYYGHLAPSIAERMDKGEGEQPTDPIRFDMNELNERRASKGKSGYALQFMLDTSLSDSQRYPLKLADLMVMNLNPEKAPVSITWASGRAQTLDLPACGFSGDLWNKPMFVDEKWTEYEGTVMALDPSGRGLDETGYAVLKMLHGVLYLTAMGGIKGGYNEIVLAKIAGIAKEQQVNTVIVEDNFGDGMYRQMLKPVMNGIYPCQLEGVWHSKQKERRIIDTLEPVMSSHKLVVDEQVVRDDLKRAQVGLSGESETESQNYSLFYQMTRITYDRGSLKHDDRLDALAIGVNWWTEFMGRNMEESVVDWKTEQLRRELDNFNSIVLGKPEDDPMKNLRWVDI